MLVNLSAFLSGTIAAWSSPVTEKLSHLDDNPLNREITDDEISWLGSLSSVGGIVGPFLYSFLMNRLGRKIPLILTAFPVIIAQLILIFIPEIHWYYVARVLAGISQVSAFFVAPVYISEISKPNVRGFLTISIATFILSGGLFTVSVGPYVRVQTLNISLLVAPSLLLIGSILFVPESPYHYIYQKDEKRAEEALIHLRGTTDIQEELEEIKRNAYIEQGRFYDIFKTRAARRAFGICLTLQFAITVSAIGPILAYSQSIFEDTGSSISPAVSSIIERIVQFVTCFALSGVIDTFGRRRMLFISTSGIMVCQIIFGVYFYLKDNNNDMSSVSWLPLVSLVFLLIFMAMGLGPLSSIFDGEIFPLDVKSHGSALITSLGFVLDFLMTLFYNSTVDAIGVGPTFWIYCGLLGFFLVIMYFTMVETKGKTLEQIQDMLSS